MRCSARSCGTSRRCVPSLLRRLRPVGPLRIRRTYARWKIRAVVLPRAPAPRLRVGENMRRPIVIVWCWPRRSSAELSAIYMGEPPAITHYDDGRIAKNLPDRGRVITQWDGLWIVFANARRSPGRRGGIATASRAISPFAEACVTPAAYWCGSCCSMKANTWEGFRPTPHDHPKRKSSPAAAHTSLCRSRNGRSRILRLSRDLGPMGKGRAPPLAGTGFSTFYPAVALGRCRSQNVGET